MLIFHNLKGLFLVLFTIFQFSLIASALPQVNKGAVTKRVHTDESTLLTNAARLQAGLGPLKPRAFYNPTRVGARSAAASPVTLTGKIQVRSASHGTSLGYVAKSLNFFGTAIGITTSSPKRLTISFTTSSPFNIAITSGGSFPYLGFAGDSLKFVDVPNYLTFTNPTPPGSVPAAVGNALSSPTSESAIWSYSSGVLTPQWINADGSSVPVKVKYFAATNSLALVHDPSLSFGGVEVTLHLA